MILYRTNGNCEPYLDSSSNRVSPCDQFFTPGVDYVYILNARVGGNQHRLRLLVEDAKGGIDFISEHCRDVLVRFLCYNYYLPCGYNGTYHVPQFVCSEFCKYVSQTLCQDLWKKAADLLITQIAPSLRNDKTLRLPNCNYTDEHISYLNLSNDCCYNGNIETSTLTCISLGLTICSPER